MNLQFLAITTQESSQTHICPAQVSQPKIFSLELMQMAVRQQQKLLSTLRSNPNKLNLLEYDEGQNKMSLEQAEFRQLDQPIYALDPETQVYNFDVFNDEDSQSALSPIFGGNGQIQLGVRLISFPEIANPTQYESYFAC